MMKLYGLAGILVVTCLSATSALAKSARVDYLHIPPGFDDNDEIEVTLDGYLDDCQKLADAEVFVDQETKEIQIHQKTTPVEPCLFPVVPFSSTVRVARALPAGQYTVVAGHVERSLDVKEATVGAVDEHTYAPVDSVSIEQNPQNKKYYVVLRGRWQVSCMKFDGAILPQKERSVIEILPKVYLDDSLACDAAETSFEKRVELPGLVPGHYLVHVRSMSGASFNLLHVVYRMN